MNKIFVTAITAAALLVSSAAADAQPNTRLRPDKTVFLYRETPVEISDPVQGKEKEALGPRT